MRIEDAPPAGWYPDPEGSTRLRWWDGTDWTTRFRPYPSTEETAVASGSLAVGPHNDGAAAAGWYSDPAGGGGQRWWDGSAWTSQLRGAPSPSQIVDQVRGAVREEAERAASQFGAQARHAARDIGPLISDVTNRAATFLKRLVVLAVILGVAWFVFQAYANATFFEWLGDRIDQIGNNAVVTPRAP